MKEENFGPVFNPDGTPTETTYEIMGWHKCEQCGRWLNPVAWMMGPICKTCVDKNYKKMMKELTGHE